MFPLRPEDASTPGRPESPASASTRGNLHIQGRLLTMCLLAPPDDGRQKDNPD